MKVNPGTKEYEDNIRNARELLARLRKGKAIFRESIRAGNLAKAGKVMELYDEVAGAAFKELEMATLILQFQMSHSSVWVRSDGSLIKAEDVVDEKAVELDPWMLYSTNMLMNVFGPDIKEYIEFKD